MKKFRDWLEQQLIEATFTYTLDRPEGQLQVTVKGNYHPASRGQRDSLGGMAGMGPALEPDEGEEFEIDSVTDQFGNDVEITPEEEELLTQAFFHQGA